MGYQPPLDHAVFFDGVALNTLGWDSGSDGVAVTGVGGWFDAPEVRDVRSANPGRDGELADNLFLGGRTVTVEGWVSGSSYADLQARKRLLASRLVPSSVEKVFKLPVVDAFSGSVFLNVMSRSGPVGWWRFGDLASLSAYNSYASTVSGLSPTAYWRLNDRAFPPVTNSYDATVLGRADTVAYWELGEASGTTAANSVSGGAYPGTIAGSPVMGVTGPLLGSGDMAIQFDGSNDGVSIADSAALHPAAVTMSAWVKPSAVSGRANYILSTQQTGFKGIGLRLDNSGKVECRMGDGIANSSTVGTSAIPLGQWAHVALTYDGTTVRVYCDGVLENSAADAYSAPTDGARIGYALSGNFSEAFRGEIAKVSLHNAALTAAEIGDLFTRGRPVADSVGAYTGGMIAAPVSATGALLGDSNAAFDFNGSSDAVIVPYNAALNAATFSITGWIQSDTVGDGFVRFICDSRNGATATQGWVVSITAAGKINLFFAGSTDTPGATTLQPGLWYHFAATYDGTTSKVYLNGVLDGSASKTHVQNTSGPLYIGQRFNFTSAFKGKIDELSYHGSKVLTANEIATLFACGWRAQDQQNTYHAGYANKPTNTTGAILNDTNTATTLNGTNQYALIPYAAALNPTSITISTWIKRTTDSGATERILDSRSGDNTGYVLSINATDKATLEIGNGTSLTAATSTTSITPGTWYHIVATYDGTNARIYVNNTLENTSSNVTISANTSANLIIGANRTPTTLFFPGSIDELAIYSRVLSDTDRTRIYTAGTQGYADEIPNYERVSARVIDGVTFGENVGPLLQPWAVTLRASDPLVYRDTLTTVDSTTTGTAERTVTVTNYGTYPSPGQIVVTGPTASAWDISDSTNKTVLEISSLALASVSNSTIDLNRRTIYTSQPYKETRLSLTGTRALWLLDETSGTTADNAQGTAAYDATYNGGYVLNQAGPATGLSSVDLNGTTGYVSLGYQAGFWWSDAGDGIVLEFWLNPDAISGDQVFFDSISGYLGLRLQINSSGQLVETRGRSGAIKTTTYPTVVFTAGAWNHLAFYANGVGRNITLNGFPKNISYSKVGGSPSGIDPPTATGLRLGATMSGTGFFNGKIGPAYYAVNSSQSSSFTSLEVIASSTSNAGTINSYASIGSGSSLWSNIATGSTTYRLRSPSGLNTGSKLSVQYREARV